MNIGSLFSGIGGLELGLEWAGLGPVVWQVEIDPWCREVLASHWPDAQRYDDVRAVRALPAVDLICGGFPCQDVSSAGKAAGLRGARSGLWFQFHRVVAEVRPQWVVVENVLSGASRWLDAVRHGLEELGYSTLPVPIAASDVGAWHRRQRLFVVAHADAQGQSCQEGQADEGRSTFQGGRWSCDAPRIWANEPDVARLVHGLPRRLARERRQRERALGNAVVPQCAEVVGWIIRSIEGW